MKLMSSPVDPNLISAIHDRDFTEIYEYLINSEWMYKTYLELIEIGVELDDIELIAELILNMVNIEDEEQMVIEGLSILPLSFFDQIIDTGRLHPHAMIILYRTLDNHHRIHDYLQRRPDRGVRRLPVELSYEVLTTLYRLYHDPNHWSIPSILRGINIGYDPIPLVLAYADPRYSVSERDGIDRFLHDHPEYDPYYHAPVVP